MNIKFLKCQHANDAIGFLQRALPGDVQKFKPVQVNNGSNHDGRKVAACFRHPDTVRATALLKQSFAMASAGVDVIRFLSSTPHDYVAK